MAPKKRIPPTKKSQKHQESAVLSMLSRQAKQQAQQRQLEQEQRELEQQEQERLRALEQQEEERRRQRAQQQVTARQHKQPELTRKQRQQLAAKRRALGLVEQDGVFKLDPSKIAKSQTAANQVESVDQRIDQRVESAVAGEVKLVDGNLRSPICCVLGHVDTGKTLLLDRIRTSHVQAGEAGGITQQIGATHIPSEHLLSAARHATSETREIEIKTPGLLVIDTPGHEAFNNLRSRGASMCDLAVLVVDIMHGIEPQTIESVKMLAALKTPFVVALNKTDCITGWPDYSASNDTGSTLRQQIAELTGVTRRDFQHRVAAIKAELAGLGYNSELFFDNRDPKRVVSVVPVSAKTGQGISELLYVVALLTGRFMESRIRLDGDTFNCVVMETGVTDGFGHTLDAILVNGTLREGDRIAVCTMNGVVETRIRILLTPPPLTETRVKSRYQQHRQVNAAAGIKIVATGLDGVIPGSRLALLGASPEADKAAKQSIAGDLDNIRIELNSEYGVYVVASSLGSLEALLGYLREHRIPVSGFTVGSPGREDIIKASTCLQSLHPEYGVLLVFATPISREIATFADANRVKIIREETIYRLVEQFEHCLDAIRKQQKANAAGQVVFPCQLDIVPDCIFHAKNPIVIGVEVVNGLLYPDTPIFTVSDRAAKDGEIVDLGMITEIQRDGKAVPFAKTGEKVAVSINTSGLQTSIMFGRQFDQSSVLYSKLSRVSIDKLKQHYREEMRQGDRQSNWELVIQLKRMLSIV